MIVLYNDSEFRISFENDANDNENLKKDSW
jgi:hypothetical protein